MRPPQDPQGDGCGDGPGRHCHRPRRAWYGFRSLQEAIDTATAAGKLMVHIFTALAGLERDPFTLR